MSNDDRTPTAILCNECPWRGFGAEPEGVEHAAAISQAEIDRLTSENARLRDALQTVARYADGLRATNWYGLADVAENALAGAENGRTDQQDEVGG